MGNKKFGSLFESILNKSPDTAKRLKEMAKGKRISLKMSDVADVRKENTAPRQPKPLRKEREQENTVPGLPEALREELERGELAQRMQDSVFEKKSTIPEVEARQKPIVPKLPAVQSKPPAKKNFVTPRPLPRIARKTERQFNRNQDGRFFDEIPAHDDQFNRNGDSSKSVDIVVGVDFGTSSTKVVVRAPYYVDSPGFAIPFGEWAHNSLEYLLPTQLSVDKDGQCFLQTVKGASILTDIKVALMQKPRDSVVPVSGLSCNASAMTIATAYLALVLRYARCWFIKNKRDIFGNFSLKWSCNLGLPAAIDDNPDMRKIFETVGNAAWLVSMQPGAVKAAGVCKTIEDIRNSRFKKKGIPDFDLIPEVIAEVMGYARSKFRMKVSTFLWMSVQVLWIFARLTSTRTKAKTIFPYLLPILTYLEP